MSQRKMNTALMLTLSLSINISISMSAFAAEPLECQRDSFNQTRANATAIDRSNTQTDDKIRLSANSIAGSQELITLRENVEVDYLGQKIKTNIAEFNPLTGEFTTPDTVSLESKIGKIEGLEADFDLIEKTATFSNARFHLSDGSRGSATQLTFNEQSQEFDGVVYSGCPEGSVGWELIAPSIILDQEQQRGYARKVKLEFANIPIFYLPYFSFPLNNQRKSGFLIPNLDSSDKSGLEIGLPYYWNIAENYDATFTPTFLTERGLQVQNEFRHLLPFSQGNINLDFTTRDKKTNDGRHYLNIDNQFQLGPNWDIQLKLADVSDSNYFIDYGGSLSSSTISNLNRSLSAQYYGNYWNFYGTVQDYQIIDPRISSAQEPFRRLPQLGADYEREIFSNLSKQKNYQQSVRLKTSAELVNFTRNFDTGGIRANLYPQIEHQFSTAAINVTTNLGIQHTQYTLDDEFALADNNLSRTLPILNIDSRLHLERTTRHTLLPDIVQPRAQYTYIPYRSQQDIPLFDTDLPDITQNQLFNPSRFNGLDRIGDTNQLTYGLSSWLIGGPGTEKQLNFDIGQVLYFSDRTVGLNQDITQDARTSEIIAEAFWQPNSRLGLRSGISWDPDTDAAVRREIGFSYRPDERKLLNLGYRFVDGRVDQTDLAFRYPINQRMNLVGRWNYDRLNRATLDRYWGLEYDTCCWSIRAIARRYLSDRDGNFDNAFLIQLELKGLSSVGARADKLLEKNIFIDQP